MGKTYKDSKFGMEKNPKRSKPKGGGMGKKTDRNQNQTQKHFEQMFKEEPDEYFYDDDELFDEDFYDDDFDDDDDFDSEEYYDDFY